MTYRSNIEVEGVDLDLLHEQYLTLIAIQTQTWKHDLSSKEIDHLEGLINFLEEIFEKNPRDERPIEIWDLIGKSENQAQIFGQDSEDPKSQIGTGE